VRLAYSASTCSTAGCLARRGANCSTFNATVRARHTVGEVDQGAVIKAQLEQTRLAGG
jgi:hypothetical protein